MIKPTVNAHEDPVPIRPEFGIATEEVNGFFLERETGGVYYSIRNNRARAERGQVVIANGKFGAKEGTRGIVIKIHRPYANGKTSNVIEVHFEGHRFSHHMKFHDLVESSICVNSD